MVDSSKYFPKYSTFHSTSSRHTSATQSTSSIGKDVGELVTILCSVAHWSSELEEHHSLCL